MEVTKELKKNKKEILEYLRQRADESAGIVISTYGVTEYKTRAQKINTCVQSSSQNLSQQLLQISKAEQWNNNEILENLLMIKYCEYIVMLESRNKMWPYDYMAFARRIGELWEPFCKILFHYPINDLTLFNPPTFKDVQKLLTSEIKQYITLLPLNESQKNELMSYYEKVWKFVTSGEIQLELDLHFKFNEIKYNVDMKSGFNSNEKGNTNRLLLVGSIYKSLQQPYSNILFVRAEEVDNNHYLQTLKNSSIWSVYTGEETYNKMYEFSGFNIKKWIAENINWEDDIEPTFYAHLQSHNLLTYLQW